jgi:hypothetical protein
MTALDQLVSNLEMNGLTSTARRAQVKAILCDAIESAQRDVQRLSAELNLKRGECQFSGSVDCVDSSRLRGHDPVGVKGAVDEDMRLDFLVQ